MKRVYLCIKKYSTKNIIKIHSYFYFEKPRLSRTSFTSHSVCIFLQYHVKREILDISRRKEVFPIRETQGIISLWVGKKSNCPLIHADTPPAGMPPRNDVRVGELSSKLNIGARRTTGVAEENIEEKSGDCEGKGGRRCAPAFFPRRHDKNQTGKQTRSGIVL